MSEPTTAPPNPTTASPAPEKSPAETGSKSPVLWLVIALLLAVLWYAGLTYFVYAMTHESTDDAFIAGHLVSIAPRISGQVAAVHVLDNQTVHSNDLLVEIDPAPFATTVAQKKAAAGSSATCRTRK